jgi:hypothetical protein
VFAITSRAGHCEPTPERVERSWSPCQVVRASGQAKKAVAGGASSEFLHMHRWFLVFMFLVVPFQLVWASAAPYCAHESGVSVDEHFGHHDHTHVAGDEFVSSMDDTGEAAGAHDADCESCHLGSSAFMPAVTTAIEALPHAGSMPHPDPRYDSHIPTPPRRPDRACSAPAARSGGAVVVSIAG